MKVYTYIVTLTSDPRKESFEPVIFDTDDIIRISDFGYLYVDVFLKDGRTFTCSSVYFVNDFLLLNNSDFSTAREILCESHDVYEKLKEIY